MRNSIVKRLVLALQLALISALAFVLGSNFTSLFDGASATLGAIWCAITGIAVLQATRQGTWKEGIRQLLGTLIGVSVAGIYLWLFSFSAVGLAICVGATVLFCEILGMSETTKLAATSVVMIMVISLAYPDLNPFVNSALRFCEACIGTGIAMLIALLSSGLPVAAKQNDQL